MSRLLSRIFVLVLVVVGARADAETLPRPAQLEPQIQFWSRIYSEVDSGGGMIHDSTEMGVIYEVIRIPEGLSARSREQRIERTKNGYVAILRRLGDGKRSGLSSEEKRVLALWPSGVSNKTLKDAASRVRFQLGQADRFHAGLERAGRWSDHISQMLQKHGVPAELAALPHVESSYNPAAYSRVGAAGLWQFTRSTGRLFMRVDNVVDERMDPVAASEGAARLLRSNYDQLNSWPLAITAYNHGVGGMKRAVRTLGTNDIAEIAAKYKGRTFGFASRNFYAEFLAAVDVDRDAEHYFGPIDVQAPVAYETVTMDHFYPAEAIERALGVDPTVLREHNGSLRPAVWNGAKYIPQGYVLRVPADAITTPAPIAIASIAANQKFAQQHRDRLYEVHRGDSLSKIARRYGVKESTLVSLNNLRNRHSIRAGQVLVLPDEPGARAPVAVARVEPPSDGIYRVRRGDTVSLIASRFGVTEATLVNWNGLRNRHHISVGQPLRVSSITAQAESTEAAEKQPVGSERAVSVATTPVEIAVAPKPSQPAVPKSESAATTEVLNAPAEVEIAMDQAAVSETEIAAIALDSGRVDEPVDPTPSLSVEYPEQDPNLASAVIPAPDPSDYAVTETGRITVQAAETLGHYAEWLEVPTSRLRRLNRMRYETPVTIGRQTVLDFSVVSQKVFEYRRLDYHRTLQEEFFDAYEVVGTEIHVLARGDTLWYLAEERYRVPVWLLRQHNPSMDFGALQTGARLTIPRISPRRG
jgi:membrane-bound lytic murein transglycosylase D